MAGLVWVALFALLLLPEILALGCIGDDGAAVDWWIVMKKAFGLGYMYVDNRMNGFVVSRHSLGSANEGAVSRTLNATMQHSFAFFNAHSPTGGSPQPGSVFSHSAGVFGISSDAKDGIYMPHNVVRWPNPKGPYAGYITPPAGVTASSIMCLSVTAATIESIAKTFVVNPPKLYRRALSPSVAAAVPTLNRLCNGYHTTVGGELVQIIKTKGNFDVTLVMKFTRKVQDIYAVHLAPYYKADVYTATWQLGNGTPRPDLCSPPNPYAVRNVLSFRVAGVTQRNAEDHSKLAFIPSRGVFCLGDINRMDDVQEPGRLHCMLLPKIVEAIAPTMVVNNSCH